MRHRLKRRVADFSEIVALRQHEGRRVRFRLPVKRLRVADSSEIVASGM